MRQISTEAILNRKDTQLSYDQLEPEAEQRDCPLCGYRLDYWYITAFNGDGDYLDSLQSYKCSKCEYEQFVAEDEELDNPHS